MWRKRGKSGYRAYMASRFGKKSKAKCRRKAGRPKGRWKYGRSVGKRRRLPKGKRQFGSYAAVVKEYGVKKGAKLWRAYLRGLSSKRSYRRKR